MMKAKVWKCLLLICVAICMAISIGAQAKLSYRELVERERDRTSERIMKNAGVSSYGHSGNGLKKVLEPIGWIVVDITSGPAHATVMTPQLLFPRYSEKVKKEKMKIRKRLSVRKKEKRGGEGEEGEGEEDFGDEFDENVEDEIEDEEEQLAKKAGAGNDWYYYDIEDGVNSEKGKKIDAKLSKIRIRSNEVTDIAGEGIAGMGVDNIIRTQGNTSAQKLFDAEQGKYVSAAGTEEEQERYELLRQYNEQEQAIQMIGYAATVRQNVADTIEEMVDRVEENFKKSGDKKKCDNGCVKWDLDPKNKDTKVHKNTDYNQVLRQYAYYSLVYDQMLSLEQQIIGLRLQVRGAASEQKASVLSDMLESEKRR